MAGLQYVQDPSPSSTTGHDCPDNVISLYLCLPRRLFSPFDFFAFAGVVHPNPLSFWLYDTDNRTDGHRCEGRNRGYRLATCSPSARARSGPSVAPAKGIRPSTGQYAQQPRPAWFQGLGSSMDASVHDLLFRGHQSSADRPPLRPRFASV